MIIRPHYAFTLATMLWRLAACFGVAQSQSTNGPLKPMGSLVLNCGSQLTVMTDPGLSTASVTFVSLFITPGLVVAYTPASGTEFTLGTTSVLMVIERKSDGLTANCTFEILVTNEEPLNLTFCPPSIAVRAEGIGALRGRRVTWITATVQDRVAVTTSTHLQGDFFPLGLTTVTVSVKDAASNTTHICGFDVLVEAEPIFLAPPLPVQGYQDTLQETACQVSAYPVPLMTWRRSDGLVVRSENTTVLRLTFARAALTDAGTYICRAENALGSVESAGVAIVLTPFEFACDNRIIQPWPMLQNTAARLGTQNLGFGAGPYRVPRSTVNGVTTGVAISVSSFVFGAGSKLQARSVSTGSLLWSVQAQAVVAASPALNILSDTVYAGTEDGFLLAVKGGMVVWRSNVSSPLPMQLSPAVDTLNGNVLVGAAGHLVAFTATGAESWRFSCVAPGAQVQAAPALKDNKVFCVCSDGTLYQLNATSGAMQWEKSLGDPSSGTDEWPPPAVLSDSVLASAGNQSLYRLSTTDGSEVWKYMGTGRFRGFAFRSDTMVVYVAEENRLLALSWATGNELYMALTNSTLSTAPIFGSDGSVYVGIADSLLQSHLVALDHLLRERWRWPLLAPINRPLAYGAPDAIYVGTRDNKLLPLANCVSFFRPQFQRLSKTALRITWTRPTTGAHTIKSFLVRVADKVVTETTSNSAVVNLAGNRFHIIGVAVLLNSGPGVLGPLSRVTLYAGVPAPVYPNIQVVGVVLLQPMQEADFSEVMETQFTEALCFGLTNADCSILMLEDDDPLRRRRRTENAVKIQFQINLSPSNMTEQVQSAVNQSLVDGTVQDRLRAFGGPWASVVLLLEEPLAASESSAPAESGSDNLSLVMILMFAGAGAAGCLVLIILLLCCCRRRANAPMSSFQQKDQSMHVVKKNTFDGYHTKGKRKFHSRQAVESLQMDSWILFQQSTLEAKPNAVVKEHGHARGRRDPLPAVPLATEPGKPGTTRQYSIYDTADDANTPFFVTNPLSSANFISPAVATPPRKLSAPVSPPRARSPAPLPVSQRAPHPAPLPTITTRHTPAKPTVLVATPPFQVESVPPKKSSYFNMTQPFSPPSSENINIAFRDLLICKQLSQGEFGTVSQGEWRRDHNMIRVAIKSVKPAITLDSEHARTVLRDLYAEATLMVQLQHPNIVALYGISTDQEVPLLVLELMELGSADEYLLTHRVPLVELVHMLCQACTAMEYLAQQNVVHRDLAARNTFLQAAPDNTNIVKVGDFGLSRTIKGLYYLSQSDTLLPIRWLPLEAVFYKKFSTGTDVWSFGILMWEYVTYCEFKPYHEMSADQLIRAVEHGYRLPRPLGCPEGLYQIMTDCWQFAPADRPDFIELSMELKAQFTVLQEVSRNGPLVTPMHSYVNVPLAIGGYLRDRLNSQC